jgi:hypothetical protein
MRPYQSLQIVCEVCGRSCNAAQKGRDICLPCLRKEPSVPCTRCSLTTHHADPETGQCPRCVRVTSRLEGICAHCSRTKVIFNQEAQLCKQCHDHSLVPGQLRKYIANFATPYPYNNVLFDTLAAAIDWASVNKQTKRKFHSFGRFLQTQPLNEPLTWEAIEALLPPLGPTNRNDPKLIRACLLELGHLLAARGELENRETYIDRRYALAPIGQAPMPVQALMRRYATWLQERRTMPTNVRDHLEVLASFWSWSELRSVHRPEEVQVSLVNDYLLHLYWKWRCSTCQSSMAFDPRERNAPRMCKHCGTIGTFVKEKRLAQNTVRGHRAKLFVFFDWLKMNRMVISNPVQSKVPAPSPTIQHYSLDVIKQLCEYMRAPDADPVAALILYLVIFHALTVWELRHVTLPTFLPLRQEIPLPGLAESYYVIIPKPEPSLGDRSPGRPDVRLDFPAKAAPWLKPLLNRFERQRQLMAPNPQNRYLFINSYTRHHNTPVGHDYIWSIIRRASGCILGASCNPNTLRKTAGVMFADRAGAGILRWMGWDDQQAFKYAWAPREVIQPQQLDGSQDAHLRPGLEPIPFPSPKTRKNDTRLRD